MRTLSQLVIGSCIAIAVIALVAGSQGDPRSATTPRSDALAQSTRVADRNLLSTLGDGNIGGISFTGTHDNSVQNLLQLRDEQVDLQGGCGAQCGRIEFCCGGCQAGDCLECCPLSSPPVPDRTE